MPLAAIHAHASRAFHVRLVAWFSNMTYHVA